MGGIIDITADPKIYENTNVFKAIDALKYLKTYENNLMSSVTVSSDSMGSLPVYDSNGQFLSCEVAKPDSLMYLFKRLIEIAGFTIEEALPFFTSNVAVNIGLAEKKGKIKLGFDADMLVLNELFEIEHVVSKGKIRD